MTSGRKPSPITQGTEEETEKRLSGLLMRGDQVIVVADEAAIYIKLDTELLDRTTLESLVNTPAPTACEA